MSDVPGSANDAFVRAIEAEAADRNVSQAELARRVGVKPPQMNLYLTPTHANRRVLKMDMVSEIADALGISLVDLAIEADRRRRAPTESRAETPDEMVKRKLSGPPE